MKIEDAPRPTWLRRALTTRERIRYASVPAGEYVAPAAAELSRPPSSKGRSMLQSRKQAPIQVLTELLNLRRLLTISALLCGSSLACNTPTVREAEPLLLEEEDFREPDSELTIARATLEDVISKGPGRFFERVEVEPAFASGGSGRPRFLGYTLRTFYGGMTPASNGVQVGDVVTALNGLAVSRPDEFMKVWKSALLQDALEVDVLRDGRPLRFVYLIVIESPASDVGQDGTTAPTSE